MIGASPDCSWSEWKKVDYIKDVQTHAHPKDIGSTATNIDESIKPEMNSDHSAALTQHASVRE